MLEEKFQPDGGQQEKRQQHTDQANYKVNTGQTTHISVRQRPKSWCPPNSHDGCGVGGSDEEGETEGDHREASIGQGHYR